MAYGVKDGSSIGFELHIAKGSEDGIADGFENGSWLGFELLGIEEG